MKIRVRNFQSIRKIQLEVEGFTVITGRSNVGKTALIRACRAAFFGIPGDYFIREGESFTGVAITDDDLEIVWRKTRKPDPKKPSALQVNGVVHTKIGKDHAQLTEPCGVTELLTSQARIKPQFSMQHDNIFMLAESETTVAEILKLLGRIDVVTTAQRNAKRDLGSTASRRKVREGDLEEARLKVKSLDYVPGLRINLGKVSEQVQIMDKNNQERTDLIQKIQKVRELAPLDNMPVAPVLPTPRFNVLELLRKLEGANPIEIPPTIETPTLDTGKEILLQWLGELMQLDFQLEKSTTDLESLNEELEEQEELKTSVEGLLDACPTCDRPFDEHELHKH